MIDALQKANIPTLLMNRDYDSYNCIMTDPKESLRDGLHWLKANSGDEIALIYGKDGTAAPYRAGRIIAAYELITEMKLKLTSENTFHIQSTRYMDEAFRISSEFFDRPDIPRGIVLLDTEIALLFVSRGLSYGKIPGRDYYLLMFDMESQLMDYDGIGMLNQMLQNFCIEAGNFFFGKTDSQELFRKYIKADLWVKSKSSESSEHSL